MESDVRTLVAECRDGSWELSASTSSTARTAALEAMVPDIHEQLLAAGPSFELVVGSDCNGDGDMAIPLLRAAHRVCAPDGTLVLDGIIGGDALREFRRGVGRFFGASLELPPCEDPEQELPPTARVVHRLSAPRPYVLPDSLTDDMHASHLLGCGVWPAAFALGAALQSSDEWTGLLQGANVIELGAGSTGYVGIIAARAGGATTRVAITDKHELLVECAARAVVDNGLQAQCVAGVYSWGDESAPVVCGETYDVVLASDCLYSHGVAGAFCEALDLLVGESTRVLASCGDRWSVGECIDVCAELGWAFTAIGTPYRPSAEQLALVADRNLEQSISGQECIIYEVTRCERSGPPVVRA